MVSDGAVEALVFDGVRQVAVAYRLTVYDAAYLALALRRGVPLATLDELIRTSRAADVAVSP